MHLRKLHSVDEDAKLIQSHLAGDEDAARRLVQKHERTVFTLARQLLGTDEELRDTAQEIFLNLFQALPRFRGESAFSTWLYRIAVNTCIARSKLRKLRRLRERLADSETLESLRPDDRTPDAHQILEKEEHDTRLHRAIDALPDEYRAIVVLHYLQGMEYERIARVLEIPLGTVKVRLFRARRLLRRKLPKN